MSNTLNLYRNGFYAMATRFHAIIPALEDGNGDDLFQKVKSEVNRIESRLSRFVEQSEISKLNREAFQNPVEADEEIFEILKACKYGWEITDGAFDITLRPLLDYWRKEENQSAESLERVKALVGMEHVELNRENRTIQFMKEGVNLDLGGFGKGYALEKVKRMIERSAAGSAFISFGESSVLAMGDHPAGGAWRVGINNYKKPGESIHEFQVRDGSVSTSSNFYMNDDGKLQNHKHIISPKTGKPHEDFTSVSVKATSPILSEILSTGCLILPDNKIEKLIQKYDEIEIVRINYDPEEPNITIFEKN